MRGSSRSSRGGGWVAAQFALIALIVVSWLPSPRPHPDWLQWIGLVLALAGTAIVLLATRALGRSLTPFPRPRDEGELATDGPYAFVRHPTYLGGALFLAGVSLRFGWVGLALTATLALLWAAKARVEERHLAEKFPEYEEYSRRVRWRLVPFVY